jgi:hypothetical protein
VEIPEPSIARISTDGNTVYVLGDHTAFRFHWDPRRGRLEPDDAWRVPYRLLVDQSYAWDAVVEGGQLWFMDNGEHRYAGTMRGAGVAAGPVHLVRASLDTGAFELIPGVRCAGGQNPPLYDPARASRSRSPAMLAAFRFTGASSRPGASRSARRAT